MTNKTVDNQIKYIITRSKQLNNANSWLFAITFMPSKKNNNDNNIILAGDVEKDSTEEQKKLTGGGEKIFSAGWDLKALKDGEMQLDKWWEVDEYGFGGFTGLTENWVLNKPVIAAVNGLAICGCFEMAMGFDLLIAADHVEFGLPEMPLGIVPDAGALQRLPRRIPHNIAMEMFLKRKEELTL